MARWNRRDDDDSEKYAKIRKRGKNTSRSADLQDDFEKPEAAWAVGGEDRAFAARVVEVHKKYAFVSREPERGAVDTRDVWLATIARKLLTAERLERNFVAVGDRVLCVPAKDRQVDLNTDLPQCVMQSLAPRTSKLARLDPHKPGLMHVLAANMDQLMIVASYLSPTIKWGLIDRYLVLAESEAIPTLIVLNKRDLLADDPAMAAQAAEMLAIYQGLGYPVFSVQANAKGAVNAPEFQELKTHLAGKVTLLSGHSGVGKSSVVNLFKPELVQAVEPDSNIFYKGRHTTSFASFIRLGADAGFAIDTPGIRSFTFEDKGAIELSHCFVEMRPYLGQCKFRECRHMDEPDCVVRAAVEAGKITRWRYKSYLGILLGATGREGRIRDLPLTEKETLMAYMFDEGEELTHMRQAVRKFAENEIAPQARELDEKERFSPELTKKMGELGLFGTIVDPAYGGQGMDYISYIVAVEELARIDGSQAATIAAHNSLGAGPLYYYGTEAQKKKYLPQLGTGDGLWAFGLTEPEAGSDAQASKTTAVFDAGKNEWVINGAKIWITNSANPLTKGITVQAVTGRKGDKSELSCFIVPTGTKGLTAKEMHGKMMWRASNTGELYFDDVRVPNENMLGSRGQGFKMMMETLDNGRLSIGAMGLGLAQGALDLTIKYANERHTFGKPIAKHQAVAFKLAEMATRVEAARNLLYKACWLKQEHRAFQKEAAMAKLYCSEVAEYCAREGQQTFGGYGLMKEYPIERHYRDAALLRIGEGTSEIQRLVISRYIGC